VWDLDTRQEHELSPRDKPGGASGVAYSSDGHRLASAAPDGTVRVWYPDTGQSHALTGHTDQVNAVAYSPDGHHLASASNDMTVRVWKDSALTPTAAIDRICSKGHRDLTDDERFMYLDDAYIDLVHSDTRACPRATP